MASTESSSERHVSGAREIGSRQRTTRRAVLIADQVADWTIRVGGIGVIAAVLGIMVFLALVVVPLFTGGRVTGEHGGMLAGVRGRVMFERIDDYRTVIAGLAQDGHPEANHLLSGAQITVEAPDLAAGPRITSWSKALEGDYFALGFEDGSVRFGRLIFDARNLTPDQVPADVKELAGGDRTDGHAIYSPLPGNQVRKVAVRIVLDEPQQVAGSRPIIAVDYRSSGTVERPTRAFVTVDADRVVRLSQTESRLNLLSGKTTTTLSTTTLPSVPASMEIAGVLITEKADQVYLSERSGRVFRYDTRDFNHPILAETVKLFTDGTALTVFGFLIGEQSIVAGGSNGAVNIYFRIQREGARSIDGYTLVLSHQLEPQPGAIVAMDASQRRKLFATVDATGNVWLRYSTSERTVLNLAAAGGRRAFDAVALAPRDDAVVALAADGGYYDWNVAVPHPETTLGSIFAKVWYEGYPEPTYTWQSSSGTDSFEPKFSLVPLVFGTLKATLYSMLFAVPLALGAAIHTSEFLHPRARGVVKPTMEIMASLPSVVLGFIAALVLAPFIETWIASVVLVFVSLPASLLAGAALWQMLPERIALRFGGLAKFFVMFVVIGVAVMLAWSFGPAFERIFFAGNLKAWANGDAGSDLPFMAILLMPVSFAAAVWLMKRYAGATISGLMRRLGRTRAALLDAARGAALLAFAGALSLLAASVLELLGLGIRGGAINTYVQRNALVVGFAMGFAIIPIIYTIAEDALNSVPEHLRSASLACGATPWQTALHVVLPTALSGVFAAVMIGMGRAVGETMIVVMAAGNTPLMDWNIFNGFRALSANIAVELPEAVRDSTLYRMLFLAALTLFVITFIVNTGAEMVRLRFRKRAAQL
jgi:phosphate transport system permease protein